MKIGYKISDNIVVNSCSKNGCTTVMIQSLCYNEHKNINEYNDLVRNMAASFNNTLDQTKEE